MAKSRRVRRNPTGTLLINPRGKGKKVRRVRKNGGSFSKLLSRLTGRSKARKGKRKNPLMVNSRRRHAKRRNPLTVNPRHKKAKSHKARSHKRRNPLTVNPRHKRRNPLTVNPRSRKSKVRRHRRNPLTVNPIRIRRRKNPGMLGGVQKSAMGLLGKVPVIGGLLAAIAGMTGSVLGGAIGVLPTAYLLPKVSKYVPDMVKPFAFSIGGGVLAGLLHLLPEYPFKKEAVIGVAAAGGAVDAYRRLTGKSQDIGEVSFSSLLSGDDDMGDEELGDEEMGDEELGEELDAMGIDELGAPGAATEWADTGLGDAEFCGDDLSADEIENAAMGRRHYYAAYGDLEGEDLGRKAVRSSHKRRGQSSHAGRPGRRWGWLIMWIGMDNFQKLSKLPPKERQEFIAKMKGAANKHAERLLGQGSEPSMENAELSGLLVAA